jgi:hypothetical protein
VSDKYRKTRILLDTPIGSEHNVPQNPATGSAMIIRGVFTDDRVSLQGAEAAVELTTIDPAG